MTFVSLPFILFALLVVNGVTFMLFGFDKLRAEAGTRRIPESTLLGFSVCGGIAGAWLGRSVFRHKTRKEPFSSWLRRFAVVQALIAAVALGLMR